MSYISLTYACSGCGHHFDSLVRRSEREEPEVECPLCESMLGKQDEALSAPNVMRASWPDGRRTDTAKDLIEASKVEAESFNMPPEKRAAHKKEVAKLRTPASLRGTSKDKSMKMKDK